MNKTLFQDKRLFRLKLKKLNFFFWMRFLLLLLLLIVKPKKKLIFNHRIITNLLSKRKNSFFNFFFVSFHTRDWVGVNHEINIKYIERKRGFFNKGFNGEKKIIAYKWNHFINIFTFNYLHTLLFFERKNINMHII